jgi:antitoxin (DNA-binding transcriptional repressor) of toxin-antitoxin stability system
MWRAGWRCACDAKIDHMARASVRDLRYNFSKIEDLLQEGQEIEITKHRRVIARLCPPAEPKPPKLPDFLGRMRKIFGGKVMKVSSADLLAEERDRY